MSLNLSPVSFFSWYRHAQTGLKWNASTNMLKSTNWLYCISLCFGLFIDGSRQMRWGNGKKWKLVGFYSMFNPRSINFRGAVSYTVWLSCAHVYISFIFAYSNTAHMKQKLRNVMDSWINVSPIKGELQFMISSDPSQPEQLSIFHWIFPDASRKCRFHFYWWHFEAIRLELLLAFCDGGVKCRDGVRGREDMRGGGGRGKEEK